MLNQYNISYPKVSIIIPVYNGSDYLAHAIECALGQTYSNLEVIVVNDGSVDDGKTEAVAKAYGSKIRYYYKENGGVSSALNFGIQQMSGDYFSWLSHDDGYSESKVEDSIKMLAAFERIGKKCIAFTGGNYIDAAGNIVKPFRSYFQAGKLYSGIEVISIMTKKGTLNGCCMLIPKIAFDDVGYFDELLRYSQDSLMWYKIFLSGYELISDNYSNVMYRIHHNQTSQNRRDLYEHDTKYIVEILVQPLFDVDPSGNTLLNYIERVSRHYCKDALVFLTNYARDNRVFNISQELKLKLSICTGVIRYHMVKFIKRTLFAFWKR